MTAKKLTSRPPVVVVMGHIDHGKSTLLDHIRSANITAKEAGGITQHIGAYEAEVEHSGEKRKITFLDTPGHEAFSQMRVRGAKVADVAVLVVAADDGVQPQTMEAYETIKKSGLPFIVAMNKIDKPDAEPERVKAQLAEKEIFLEGYGGNIPFANISAKTGQGVPELLDLVLLQAELGDLKANPDEPASGVIIESKLDPKRGISSTLLIRNGTMKKSQHLVAGQVSAPVRIFEDFKGRPLQEATFSSPVRITGFSGLPAVGEEFRAFPDKKEAERFLLQLREKSAQKPSPEKSAALPEKKDKAFVQMIIKTDTAGSLEALEKELLKLKDDEVVLNMLKSGVGNINEDDTKFASATGNSVILGFNVDTDTSAKEIIERYKTPLFISDIIYKISDWLKEEIAKRKSEIPREEIIGTAKILKTFSRQKNKQVIGGKVLSGKMVDGKSFKIKRRDAEIGEGRITNLQQSKKEVKEVEAGFEFGAMTENKIEIVRDDEIVIIGK